MKAFTALVLASIIVSVSIIASPTLAYDEPSVGVKKGDWIEYTVRITGPTSAPLHNITWFRVEILNVEGAAFQANVTVRNVNGTVSSSIWKFNFTEGQVEGWVIIPPNLGTGNSFYDSSKPANVTIEGEEQKIAAGASRTITRASDSVRLVKEWDKATGVYMYSVEHPKNFIVISNAIATNMWSPQILGLNQTAFYALVAISTVLAVLILSSVMVVARRTRIKRLTLRYPLQGKIAVLVILMVLLVMVGVIVVLSFFGSEIGLSFHDINLVMQTLWTALVLVSMWFRMKGNYFMHGITMIVVVSATLVDFSAVLLMSTPSSSSLQDYFSSPLNLAVFSSHAVFSIPAIFFGVWLVALWRPRSISFAAKSKRIAQLTTVFWVLSYVVGVLEFVALHTTFFG